MASRLIIVRGNSGSGKSALAAYLRSRRPAGSLAIVGQDTVRRTILGTGDDVGTTAIGLLDLTARYALSNGFDVVVEGILDARRYADMLRALRRDHAGATHCYLYQLTFAETVRRHGTKDERGFGEDEMRVWWHGFQPIEGLDEAIIGADDTLESTAARVHADCWGTPTG